MDHPTIPLSEVAKHKTKDDCWFVISGKVMDVTKFLDEHPGGEEVLLEASGRDATNEFEDIGHSDQARSLLDEYVVGFLEGNVADASKDKKFADIADKDNKFSSVNREAQKGESASWHGFLKYILPLIILVIAFALRFLKKEEAASAFAV